MVKKTLQLLWTSEVGKVSWPVAQLGITTICYVTSQKSAYLIYLQRKPEIMQEQNNPLYRQRRDVADHLEFISAL